MTDSTLRPARPGKFPFVPLKFERQTLDASLDRARDFYASMDRRRTTRHFSTEPVPRELLGMILGGGGQAVGVEHAALFDVIRRG